MRLMRATLTVLALVALVAGASSCSLGKDEVSAKDREKQVVDAVSEAVPLARKALGAADAQVEGQWGSCPGGVGHRFTGGGTLTGPEGDTDAQLEAVRTALVDAGFEDGTQVDGHVSVSRDDVDLDFQPSPARGKGAWAVSFYGPCNRYSGDDEDYVQAANLEPARSVLP
ncbi:MAG TPA: hypothetical protein VGD39_02720 [Nocardioides sp.]